MANLSSSNCSDSRLKRELAVDRSFGRGRSKTARLTQELLRLHGINVVIDGDFGSATDTGLQKFSNASGQPYSGSIDQALIDALSQPLLRAALLPTGKRGLGTTVAAIAKQHLKEHPVEIGGPNRGPWVRFYMNGYEGVDYPWCAGFVTYVVRQAAQALNVPSPVKRTFSCDNIAEEAKQRSGKFVKRVSPSDAPPGSIFLVPHATNRNDWVHTGIIVEPQVAGPGEVFVTIEGNTNDEGSREGYEVCKRFRSCAKVDVVLL